MSEKSLASPLRDVIRRAAERNVEGPAARIRKRFEAATGEIVVVADCSGSMNEPIGSLNLSKYDQLRIALKDVLRYHPKIRVVAFSFVAEEVSSGRLPKPAGGTNLAGAVDFAAQFKPRKTVIISDGLPDSPRDAERAAEQITGSIDTIYCGPDGHPAIDFLRSLARDTGGTSVQWDGYREISTVIKGLLPPPSGPVASNIEPERSRPHGPPRCGDCGSTDLQQGGMWRKKYICRQCGRAWNA